MIMMVVLNDPGLSTGNVKDESQRKSSLSKTKLSFFGATVHCTYMHEKNEINVRNILGWYRTRLRGSDLHG